MKNVFSILSNRKGIVFDLDGTLLHTEPDIRLAINAAFKTCGFQPIEDRTTLPNLHGTLPEILSAAMQLIEAPESSIFDVMRHYNKHYVKQAHRHSILYPGAYEFLHYLDSKGIALGICTNKDEASARQALEKTSILKFFTCVTGGDTTAYAKPHSMPLLHTLKILDVEPEHTLMIGDTHVDALCAQQAKINFIHFQNGYGKSVSENYPCVGYFSDYIELLDIRKII